MSSLGRTYNINTPRLLATPHSDLSYVWYDHFMRQDSRWEYRECHPQQRRVTISDEIRCSIVQLRPPQNYLFNDKRFLVEICGEEPWTLPSIVLRIEGGVLTDPSRNILDAYLRRSDLPDLLFLKKAGGVGGGYDVNPIFTAGVDGQGIVKKIEKAIRMQNGDPCYRHNFFVLQDGVVNPVLTVRGHKSDIRLYMLLVGDRQGVTAFYACKVGFFRNTTLPYDVSSEDPRVQLTNTSQNRKFASDFSEISAVFSHENYPVLYDAIFNKFLHIAERVGVIYGPLLQPDDHRWFPFVTIIGLDAVVDSTTMEPKIVEMNMNPSVSSPERCHQIGHPSSIFMRDVFELGLVALTQGKIGEQVSDDSQFILAHVHRQ